MIDINLEAIRKRDADWRDDGKQSNRNFASMDRRALLAYIDGIEELDAPAPMDANDLAARKLMEADRG